jgi:hypothetical protein
MVRGGVRTHVHRWSSGPKRLEEIVAVPSGGPQKEAHERASDRPPLFAQTGNSIRSRGASSQPTPRVQSRAHDDMPMSPITSRIECCLMVLARIHDIIQACPAPSTDPTRCANLVC